MGVVERHHAIPRPHPTTTHTLSHSSTLPPSLTHTNNARFSYPVVRGHDRTPSSEPLSIHVAIFVVVVIADVVVVVASSGCGVVGAVERFVVVVVVVVRCVADDFSLETTCSINTSESGLRGPASGTTQFASWTAAPPADPLCHSVTHSLAHPHTCTGLLSHSHRSPYLSLIFVDVSPTATVCVCLTVVVLV